jgi:hypothetical protein
MGEASTLHPNTKDLTGRVFGKLTARCPAGSRRGGLHWLCDCECGATTSVRGNHLTHGKIISCGCSNPGQRRGKFSPRWTGHEEISGILWKNIKHGAALRSLTVDVALEFLWNLYLSQQRKCALSGVSINFGSRWGEGSASLDRRDSMKGYTKDNVQWVHKDVNYMKQDLNEAHFIHLCSLIASNKKG